MKGTELGARVARPAVQRDGVKQPNSPSQPASQPAYTDPQLKKWDLVRKMVHT